MSVPNALVLFTHVIALLGFISLTVTGEIGVVTIAVFSVALVLSFLKERFDVGLYLSQGLVTTIALLVTAYLVLAAFFLGLELFEGVLIFLVYIQVLKLLGSKGTRDVVQIYLLSFFQFLAGTILTVDFSYGIAFVAYVTVAVWAILSLNMKKESDEVVGDGSGAGERLISGGFLFATAAIAFVIFLGTAVVFVSVPRLGLGFLHSRFIASNELSTGFSNQVELGRVGEIKRDSSPVMRVRITNLEKASHPDTIYWRGIALDEFDGTTWRVGEHTSNRLQSGRDGVIWVREPRGGSPPVEQTVITEPIDSNILFAAGEPVAFRGIATNRLDERNDSYFLPTNLGYRQKYIAYSDFRRPSTRELRKEGNGLYPRAIAERYLQLPALSGRVQRLAVKLAKGYDNPYDKARSVESYLTNNMSYTLTLPKGTEAFPLDEFLFSNRAGHCEYFATAMVVLLREVGVPARIVNGFLGGEWNSFGKFYLIRESNAHSWVEVFFHDWGWVRFDPTPAGGDSLGRSPWLGSYIASYYDYLKYRWSRYVVDFSGRDQKRIFSGIRDSIKWQKTRTRLNFPPKLDFNRRWVLGAVVIAMFVWVFAGKFNVLRIPVLKWVRHEDKATSVYRKAVGFLGRRGLKKTGSSTAREYARGVLSEGGDRYRIFWDLTEKYLLLRFGIGRNSGERGGNKGRKKGGAGRRGQDYKELNSMLVRLKRDGD